MVEYVGQACYNQSAGYGLYPNMLSGFVGLGAQIDRHTQLDWLTLCVSPVLFGLSLSIKDTKQFRNQLNYTWNSIVYVK